MDEKTIIEKLTRVSDAWKAQFRTLPNGHYDLSCVPNPLELPLVWSVEDGMLFLDGVWIVPVRFLQLDTLDEAVEWVHYGVIQLQLIDGHLDILITKDITPGGYAICGMERIVIQEQEG